MNSIQRGKKEKFCQKRFVDEKIWEVKKKMKMEEKVIEIGKSSARAPKSSLVGTAVLLALLAVFTALAVVPIIASAEEEVEVRVNTPAYVEETFTATIGVDNVTDFNSGQFDLSFNSSVVNVTEVREGNIEGEEVAVTWDLFDSDTVRVLVNMPLGVGVTGSGYLAEIEFDVKGGCSEKSTLDLSNGMLVDTEAKEIDAEWYGDEVTVLCPVVTVDAPAYVEGTFTSTIRIDNVTDLNSGQFDLSFNSSVVNVTDVREGEIEGEAVPVFDWSFFDADTIRVLVKLSGVEGASGSGYLAEVEFEVKGGCSEKSTLDLSNGMLVDTEAKEIEAEWHDAAVTVVPVFDTGEGTYPSISGTHKGTITPSTDIPVHKMYTYPCIGTGGHSEYVKIWNATWEGVEAYWDGYTGDWHNIVFSEPFTLKSGETYSYTIITGSYPQIHHTDELEVESGTGTIRCTEFVDINGNVYTEWIPAIKLW